MSILAILAWFTQITSIRPNTEYSAEYSANLAERPKMQKTSIFDRFHVIFC